MTKTEAQALVALNPERYRLYGTDVVRLVRSKQKGDNTCVGCAFVYPGNGCPKKERLLLCVLGDEESMIWKRVE